MISGLHFVEALLVGLGVALALLAGLLLCVETVRGPSVESGRRWLSARWSTVAAIAWSSIAVVGLRWTRDLFDALADAAIVECDRTLLFSPIVMTICVVVLPLLATLNFLAGGSPFMLTSYLAAAGGCAFLAAAGEWRPLAPLNAAISLAIGIGVFVFLPAYALVSLTTHAMHTGFAHAVLNSFLLVVFCYVPAAGLWTMLRRGGGLGEMTAWERFLARALLALPIYFILYFLALLAGHFAVFDPAPARDWQGLASTMGMGALAVAATLWVLDRGVAGKDRGHAAGVLIAGLIIAVWGALGAGALAGLDAPPWLLVGRDTAGRIDLGPGFWVIHLTFLPLLTMLAAVVALALARVVVQVFGGAGGCMVRKPYVATALWAACAASAMFAGARLF